MYKFNVRIHKGLLTPVCITYAVVLNDCTRLDVVHYNSLYLTLAPEGKRSVGLSAIWVARNRFAVLDRTHTVHNFLLLVRVHSTLGNKRARAI